MNRATYTATLVGENGQEEVELDLIGDQPQKSFVRPGAVGDTTVDVVWELDSSAPEYTYRSSSGDGYGEGGAR